MGLYQDSNDDCLLQKSYAQWSMVPSTYIEDAPLRSDFVASVSVPSGLV